MAYKFPHISEMNISFISKLIDMTYELYIHQPKPMVEWALIKKLAKDPTLIRKFINTYHPLFRKYTNMLFDYDDDDDDEGED